MAIEGTDRNERDGRTDLQQYMVAVANAGYEEALYTDLGSAQRILTEKRIEIITVLSEESIDSIRELARRLDRHVSAVKEDLDVLSAEQVIEYDTQGREKAPRLKHRNVFVKPLLLDGEIPMND